MVLDARAFTAFEQTAHDRIADSYAAHFAPLTSLALEPLLDAAQIAPGQQVLDVATGPGIAAAAAQERKATTIGVDVSANMIALAQVDHPEVTFHTAEVTSLPFASGAFDAGICNFGHRRKTTAVSPTLHYANCKYPVGTATACLLSPSTKILSQAVRSAKLPCR
jgi:SAM-dependent methyltransferase